MEHNECIIDAVEREVLEETGRVFTPTAFIGSYFLSPATNGKHYLRMCFCGDVDTEQQAAPLDPDILTTHWLTLEQICQRKQQLRSALVLKSLDDYLAGLRYPLQQFHFTRDENHLAQVCYNRLI